MALELVTVRNALVAAPAVDALVQDQVYYLQLPEDVQRPAIVLKRVQASPERSLTGATGPPDLNTVIVEYWAPTYERAGALRDAARAALAGMGAQLEIETEEYDQVVRLFSIIQHWVIWI